MEFQECLDNRRSIRDFKKEPISKEVIYKLIEAAQKAPSWKNSQVSRYYIVEELKEELLKYMPDFNINNAKNAPILIVTTVVKNRSGFERDGSYSTHIKDGFQYFDNGLQVQNLCLKAYEMGLGTLIMGLYDVEKVRKLLDIPEEQEIVTIIAVGYPNEKPEIPRRKNIEDIVVFK